MWSRPRKVIRRNSSQKSYDAFRIIKKEGKPSTITDFQWRVPGQLPRAFGWLKMSRDEGPRSTCSDLLQWSSRWICVWRKYLDLKPNSCPLSSFHMWADGGPKDWTEELGWVPCPWLLIEVLPLPHTQKSWDLDFTDMYSRPKIPGAPWQGSWTPESWVVHDTRKRRHMLNNLNSRPLNREYNCQADLNGSYGICPECGWVECYHITCSWDHPCKRSVLALEADEGGKQTDR